MPQANKPKFIKLLIATAFVLFIVCICFTTVKAITHSSFNPTDGGNATASQNITVTMDEMFYFSSGYITIYNNDTTQFEQFYISGSDTAQVTGYGTSTLTINPTTNFTTGNSYYVNIDSSLMVDGSWMNYYAGISDSTTWNFTVADLTKPSISSVTPADGAVKVLTGMNLTIVFDEAIDIQTGNLTIKNASGDTTLETIAVNSAKVTGNGSTTITINPANGLTASANLYVQIDNGAFYDLYNNDYDGISNSTTWNFATWSNSPNWYNDSWAYRIKITVQHSKVNGDLADFPVMVNLNELGGDFFDHVKADGTDIVVTDFTGNGTKLARELESINTTDNTGILWFKATNLYNAVNGDFYIYYGYASATETNNTATWKSSYQQVSHFTETPTASDDDSEFQDSTSKNNDGKSKGTMGSGDKVAGQIGNGVDLDGSNDYLDYSNITAIDTKPKASFSAWFKRANTTSTMPIFNKGSSSSVIDIYSDSSEYKSTTDDAYNYNYVSASNDTNWHYMVSVFDGAASGNSNRFKFYIDGTAQSLTYSNFGSTTGGESASLYVGYHNVNAGTHYAPAVFDEVHISNGSFSAAWIKTEYDNQNSPSTFYTVAAEESSAPDTTPPAVSSYSPADGATGVSATTDLIIVFNEVVDVHTGNLYIRKTSDDTTAETISIASGQVTGNGTTTITINPSVTLDTGIGYYINIDNGTVSDAIGNNYAGISANGTWNFTTQIAPGAWWNADWLYREKITIENSKVNGSTALTNFPIYVNLNHLSSHFFDYVNSDGSDIRITDNLGNLMAREIAYINTTNNAGELFFIANGSLSATANSDYYLYYANPTATEPTANGAYAKESVWKANYLGVWHFSQDPWYYGAKDSTSNNYDCTQSGGMDANDLVTGKVNYALDFDGTNDYVSCGTSISTALQSQANLTLSGWFKRRSSSNYVTLGTYDGGYILSTYSIDGNVNAYPGSYSGNYGYKSSNDTNWHYVNWLYDGSLSGNSNRLKLYFDGVASTMTYGGTVPATSHSSFTNPFTIGYVGGMGYNTNGFWDEVRVSSVTRTPDWAKTEYDNLNSPSTFYTIAAYQTATDTKAPTLVSFTPSDGSTGVRYNTNLIMVFSEYIDTQSGNITIKKSSDDSTVQTIAANSASVTGNGTSTLTVNINDLSGNNGYYLNIASGAITDLAGNSYTGIANTTSWNFTTETVGSWYNGDWAYRVKVTVNANYVNGDVANFPVYLNLNGLNATAFFDYVNTDGSDIRVTKIDGTTLVAREVAYISPTTNAGELYFVANGTLSGTYNGSYYIYYANPSATEPTANGTYAKESVWVNNYVGVWHFTQNPWTYGARDSTSNNYDCTQSGGMDSNDLVAGKVNYALDFDGTNDYVSCGTSISAALQSQANLTLSGWFKRRSSSNYVTLGTYDGGYILSTYSIDGNVNAYPGSYSGNYGYKSSNDTNWHYVNWLYDGTQTGNNAEALKLYFDGVASTMTYAGTIPATSYSSFTNPFTIGYVGGMGYNTNGFWDEVRVVTATRSADWAVTEYNNLNSPATFITFSSIETGTDTKAPTLVSFTPSDGSTGVRYNTNLTMTFSEYIDTQSGNITVKKSSDDSTVQTIAANSASVTGNGTATLTVNINDLSSNNGYYLNIANDAIKDLAGNSYAGISNTTTWNFTTESLGAWYNGDWLYRVKVTVNANYVNGDVANFPVYLNLNGLNATAFFDYVNPDGSDIRVTKIDGTTLVAREVAYISPTTNAGELYFVANGTLSGTYNGSYYIYYANPSATEPTANGTYAKESVWVNNYVGVWHFTQNPWTYGAKDSTSNNYDCTQSGNMDVNDLVSGKVNYALDFDGTNDYVNCGTSISAALQSQANLTLSGWFKRRSSSNYVTLGTYDGGYILSVYSIDGNVNAYPGSYSGNYGYKSSNDTNWHYVNWLYDGTQTGNNAEALKLYFDGVASTMTYAGTIPATSYSSFTNPFTIGYVGGMGYNTNGFWDEVRVVTATRSADWAVTEYNNLNSPATFITFSSIETGTDTKAPTLVSFTPSDGSTGVRYNTNLTMNFSEYIDTQSGNITIKKSFDDSTVQTIAANSASVTGNGTATLTVNINDLSGNNGYYLNIASGAITDLAGNSYTGIANTTSWNFTTETLGNWYDDNWSYRVKITVEENQVNGDVANFPIYLNLSDFSSKNLFNLAKSDGSDIRITKIDGTTLVAREVAYFDATNNAGELYFVANGTLSGTYNGSYYMYFGNAGASEPAANGTYAKESVWLNNYVGVWHFTADPSVTNNDSTSNNYDCSQSGGMDVNDLVSGKVNYALDFDGTNDYVDCGTSISAALQSQANLTLSAWFKRRASSNYVTLGTYDGGYILSTYSIDGNVNAYPGSYSGNYGYKSSNDTNWHYVNWLYDGSQTGNNAEALKLYFDGVASTMTYAGTIPATSYSSFTNPFTIGYVGGMGYNTNGFWDEVRIVTATRSGDWSVTEYNNLNSPSTFYTLASLEENADLTAPTVSSYSPTDGNTAASVGTNLVIVFDDTVVVVTGNLVIKLTSDDSTVQTIDITSGAVTGTGTNTITINPPSNLTAGTGYYINIDATAIDDDAGNSYAGISNTTTWNFTTAGGSNMIFFDMGF